MINLLFEIDAIINYIFEIQEALNNGTCNI